VKIRQKHEEKSLTSSTITTMQIPPGGKIQSLPLYFKQSSGASATEAHIRAEISNIRLAINGQDIINCPAVQLLDMYEIMGVKVQNPAAVAGCLELNIGRLLFANSDIRDLFGFGTADVTSIQVQITAGTLSSIASVQAYSERDPVAEKLGTYCNVLNFPVNYNAASQHSLDTLPKNADTAYLLLAVQAGASGVISSSELRVNSVTVREDAPLNVNKQFLSNGRLDQPTGYYVHAFTEGSPKDNLPLFQVSDLRLLNTFSTAPGSGGYNVTTIGAVNMPSIPAAK
jgi:hypothetical protein